MSEEINPKFGVAMTPEQYSENWAKNSSDIERDGLYFWLADRLGPAKLVLDIGSGVGLGLLSLAKRGVRIICLENNSSLIDAAVATLTGKNISASQCSIEELLTNLANEAIQVLIVKADVFSAAVPLALEGQKFDAITCWLVGSTPDVIAGALDLPIAEHDLGTGARYRNKAHARCAELGQNLLRPGGRVHLSDRAGISSWKEKDAYRKALRDEYSVVLGSSYDVNLSDVLFQKMGQGNESSNIRMLASKQMAPTSVCTSGIGRLSEVPVVG